MFIKKTEYSPTSVRPGNINLLASWLNQPMHWVSFGFLFAIFFAPWGPVPRYVGWTISLVALLITYCKGQPHRPALDPRVLWILMILLVTGALTTAILKQDFYLWAKGFSLVLEFSFSIWLAAWIFTNEKNGVNLWLRTWYIGTAFFILWGIAQLILDPAGLLLFSNINSLGFYICLVLPLLIGAACQQTQKPFLLKATHLILVIFAIFLLFLSFTITAWATATLQFILFLIFMPSSRRILAGLLGFILILFFVLVSIPGSPLGSTDDVLSRKVVQLKTLLLIEPATSSGSTHARRDLVKVSIKLFSERPILGWGWGRHDNESLIIANFPSYENLHQEAYSGNGHNMYLNLMVRGGLIALTGVLLVHTLGIIKLGKKARLPYRRDIAIPAIILIFSIFLYSFGDDIFHFRFKAAVLFWTVLGFACMRDREFDNEAS